METPQTYLGHGLRLLRTFHSKSQKQVSEGTGIAKSYLSELELGVRPVSLKVIEKMASFFGLTPAEVLLFLERFESRDLTLNPKMDALMKWAEG